MKGGEREGKNVGGSDVGYQLGGWLRDLPVSGVGREYRGSTGEF